MRSIFVLKPSSLGDVVHTLPAVARLKAAWPEARVSWLVNPEWAPMLRDNPDVAEVVEFPRREFRGVAGWRRLRRWVNAEIRGRRPNLALDFQGLLRTALLGRLSGARRLHGLADAREGARWFYHRTVVLPRHADGRPPHAVERYLALVDDLLGDDGAAAKEIKAAPPRFALPAGDPWQGEGELPEQFVLLHPFARGEGKSLALSQVRAICERLQPTPVVVVGRGPGRVSPATLGLPAHAVNALNQTTLPQLIWLLRRAAFVVSVDSGPLHLAAALTDRLLGLHGWTDPRRVGPFNPAAHVWKAGRLWRVDELAAAPPVLMQESRGLTTALTDSDLDEISALALQAARGR